MATKNNVGLDTAAVNPVIEGLSNLLANYQVFYTNLRGLHWLIEGDKFYELHELYEEYYNEFADKIDELAERLLMIGGTPENRFSEYLKKSEVKELSGVSDWNKGVTHVLDSLKLFVDKLRNVNSLAIKAGDVGTASLTLHEIKNFEKKVWMLSAYLK